MKTTFIMIGGDRTLGLLPRGLNKHRAEIQAFVNKATLRWGHSYALRITVYESGDISLTIAHIEYIVSATIFAEEEQTS